MAEMGPGLRRRGVNVDGAFLAEFLAGLAPGFGSGCSSTTLDGKPTTVGALRDNARLAGADQVFLVVSASPPQGG
jgi:hypothetical protein